jgi:multisubunit Na+/H+ antiporter MnhB subunit
MIFPDYGTIGAIAGCLILLSLSIYFFRRTRSGRLSVRLPTRILSALLTVCSGLLICVYGCASLWNATTHSIPIYSPDKLRAVRITNVDSGALGGYTFVTLYSHRGLMSKNIFSGDWGDTKPHEI